MTKLETVRSLPGGEMQREAVQKMTLLQSQMSQLPEQTAQLAAAIEPITDALMQILPLLQSIDHRLKRIESTLPIDNEKNPLPLASKASVREIRTMLETISKQSPKWFNKLPSL